MVFDAITIWCFTSVSAKRL